MAESPIIIERIFDVPVSEVWNAITNRNEMRKWYFDLEEFRPEVDFEFQFIGGSDERKYLHICKVTEVEFEKKLTYSWRYDGYEGISFVTFELFKEGDTTRLKLTHEGLDSFPAGNTDFVKSNFIEGWTMIIGTSLKEYLQQK